MHIFLIQVCTEALRRFLNNPRIPEPVEVLYTRWFSNPYICGAYGASLPLGISDDVYYIMMEPVYGTNNMETKDDKVNWLDNNFKVT